MDFGGKRALVIEDDPAIRKMIRKYLEVLGFAVDEAATGKAALSQLEGEPVLSLVCLDLMLPEMSGYEICERIRRSQRLKDLPVLVISARTMPSDRVLAEEVGASMYLVKPIRWTTFSKSVKLLFKTD